MKVCAYIDGYNLYHALKRFEEPHLKWLDLWNLCERLIYSHTENLCEVHYFTAYAHWLPHKTKRHQKYVEALKQCRVNVHLANFKNKERKCPKCKHIHKGHEEKETDVHLALSLLHHAYQGKFDKALIISRDSDLVPAARMVKEIFPNKKIWAVSPPHLGHSNEMIKVCDGKMKVSRKQIEDCLLPEQIKTEKGKVVTRPTEYKPPVK